MPKFKSQVIDCRDESFSYMFYFLMEIKRTEIKWIPGKIKYIKDPRYKDEIPSYIWINIPTIYDESPTNSYLFSNSEADKYNIIKIREVFRFYGLKPWVNWPLLLEEEQ